MQTHNHPQTDGQKKSEIKYIIALVILCAVVNFFGLGQLPLIGPDEPRYAEVAREMYEARDWVTPRLGGIDWFEKPALTYWILNYGLHTVRCIGIFCAGRHRAVGEHRGTAPLFFREESSIGPVRLPQRIDAGDLWYVARILARRDL